MIKEYGFTLGGPVFFPTFGLGGKKLYSGKNKTFFFFAYEPRRVNDSSNQYQLFPTDAMRGGDFRNTVTTAGGVTTQDVISSFAAKGINIPVTADPTIYQQFDLAGNNLVRRPVPSGSGVYSVWPDQVLPAAFIDPTAMRLLQYLPLPNQAPFIQPNGNLANWVGRRNDVSDDDRYQFRLDHQISQANRIYLRHSHIPITGYRYNNLTPEEAATNGPDQVNALIGDAQVAEQWVVSDAHIFSPSLVNELRLGYSRGDFSRLNPPKWQTAGFAQLFGLPSVTEANLPYFSGFPFRGVGNENISLLGNEIDESFQIADTLTKTHGNQAWKFGTDLRQARLKTAPVQRAAGGEYSFSTQPTSSRGTGNNPTGGNAFASFLLGVPASYSYRNTVLPYYYRWAAAALFFQDDWKVRPNLTLNLGLRYALQLPRWEKYNRQGSFIPELAMDQALTDAQRRSIASAIGIPDTDRSLYPFRPPRKFRPSLLRTVAAGRAICCRLTKTAGSRGSG